MNEAEQLVFKIINPNGLTYDIFKQHVEQAATKLDAMRINILYTYYKHISTTELKQWDQLKNVICAIE